MEQLEHPVQCPFCGETIWILLDPTAGATRYTEDCQVCCNPIDLQIAYDNQGDPSVRAERESE